MPGIEKRARLNLSIRLVLTEGSFSYQKLHSLIIIIEDNILPAITDIGTMVAQRAQIC